MEGGTTVQPLSFLGRACSIGFGVTVFCFCGEKGGVFNLSRFTAYLDNQCGIILRMSDWHRQCCDFRP